jgi:hypothetical protein
MKFACTKLGARAAAISSAGKRSDIEFPRKNVRTENVADRILSKNRARHSRFFFFTMSYGRRAGTAPGMNRPPVKFSDTARPAPGLAAIRATAKNDKNHKKQYVAAGGWRLAAGGWRLAAGGWRLADQCKKS